LLIGKKHGKRAQMFDEGGDNLFAEVVAHASVYGEYGCGKSTKYVAKNTQASIVSVDTSKEWADKTKKAIHNRSNVLICHVNCGPVGAWGRPLNFDYQDKFHVYHFFPWSLNQYSPDVVLIDGRFRVACFLATLIRAKPATQILFDDYCDRPHYHIIEKIIKPERTSGRMALFARPALIDVGQARKLYNEYRYETD